MYKYLKSNSESSVELTKHYVIEDLLNNSNYPKNLKRSSSTIIYPVKKKMFFQHN